MCNDKSSLVEATMLALQGKLVLNEEKSIKKTKKESINVSLQDDGSTVVDTDEATVIVQEREVVPDVVPSETTPVATEVPVECPECIETPEEDTPSIDEMIDEEPAVTEVPVETEEIVSDETEDEEDEEEDEEEGLEESKKVEAKVTDYIDEDDLDKIIKDNTNFKDCKNYEAVEDMILKVATDTYTDFNKSYKVVKHSDGKYYAYLLNDKNEKAGDEFILFEGKKAQESNILGQDTPDEIAAKEDAKSKGLYTESLKTDLEGLTSGLYDYIANNYSKLSTEELKELALNAVYVANNDKEIIAETIERLDENKEVEKEDTKSKELCKEDYDISYHLAEYDKVIRGDNDTYCVKVENRTAQTETKWLLVDKAYIEAMKNLESKYDDKKEESKLKFSSKSFKKVIENYYKENYKTIKEFNISKVLKGKSKLKIEGVLINKFGKTRDICLEANLIQKGKSFNKYNIVETSNVMLENKKDIKLSLMTFTNKNNILECKYLKKYKIS